jgi:glycine oxidase
MKGSDWVVVGGGVIGLAAAWQLARAGARVTLLEARTIGEGTSTKAAGMLLPDVEAVRRAEALPLMRESMELYPAFVKALESDSHLSVHFTRSGCLAVAPADRFAEAWPDFIPEPADALAARQPGLAPGLAGTFLPAAAHLDAAALVGALAAACRLRGVDVREGAAVTEIRHAADRWLSLRTPSGWVNGDRFLLATGAWTSFLEPQIGTDLGVYPVKGQLVEVEGPPELLRTVVFGPGAYLCPKEGGRILVGATMEESGFDQRVTAGGISRVLTAAEALFPPLKDCRFSRAWAGLRPARKGLPVIEAIAQNAFAAVGHFRNGILLAPVTVERFLRLADA